MSRVTKRTVTHLDVQFDADVLDADTGEVLYQRPIVGRFHDGSAEGFFGVFEPFSFQPGRQVRELCLRLRVDLGIGHMTVTAAPLLANPERDGISLHPRLAIDQAEWDSLLGMATDGDEQ